MKGYQQGDCILVIREALPEGCRAVKPGEHGYVLAEGEATGHRHTIEATPDVELYEKDGTLWLRVAGEPRTLTHQEHGPQMVPAGTYEIRRVVEVDPFADEVRVVAD